MNRRALLKSVALLLGGAVSGPVTAAVLAGATPNTKTPGSNGLSAVELDLVAAIAEQIIPETDTPGARGALVHNFVDLIFRDWYLPEERSSFHRGLVAFNERAIRDKGVSFTECPPQAQIELLQMAEQEGPDSDVGQFFATMKELTVVGYYTSEIGATQELIYQPVPMRYKGDYLFADVEKQWSR